MYSTYVYAMQNLEYSSCACASYCIDSCECECAVGGGGAAPQPADADSAGGHEARPARGPRDDREAQGEEAGAGLVPEGAHARQRDRRRQVPRVQRAHAEGRQERVRRGHPRRPQPGAQRREEAAQRPLRSRLTRTEHLSSRLFSSRLV